MPKTYVVIPTYNEAENIGPLLNEILALNIPDLFVLVVDDDSPDGTCQIVEQLAKTSPKIKFLLRKHNRGRGFAGLAGFKRALKEGADYIIEMDADFSHHPKYLPNFLTAIQEADVVLGSRFVPGGQDINRTLVRRIVTSFARFYIKAMLGVKVNDITSGYRCFRRAVLEQIDLNKIVSSGPSIVSELLYKAKLTGAKFKEIPIVFEDRKLGETKLNLAILLKTLYMVYKFRRIYK